MSKKREGKAKVIFKDELLDFGIIQIMSIENLPTPFPDVHLGIEPITGNEDDISIAGFSQVKQLSYIPLLSKLIDSKYKLANSTNIYLAIKDKIIPGMIGGPVFHKGLKSIIGIAKAYIKHELLEDLTYSLAIPMSKIVDLILDSSGIPLSLKGIIRKIPYQKSLYLKEKILLKEVSVTHLRGTDIFLGHAGNWEILSRKKAK